MKKELHLNRYHILLTSITQKYQNANRLHRLFVHQSGLVLVMLRIIRIIEMTQVIKRHIFDKVEVKVDLCYFTIFYITFYI